MSPSVLRVASLAIAVLLLALTLTVGASGSSGSDCQGAGDAGDSFGAARSIEAPLVACAGHLDATSKEDWYSFEAVAGGRIAVDLALVGGNTNAYACLWTPSGVRDACDWQRPFGAATPEGGTWRLQVKMEHAYDPVPTVEYELSVGTQSTTYQGRFLVPHEATRLFPSGGVNGELGPDSGLDGIDGSWISLPALAGGEWMQSYDLPGVDLRFYDADGTSLGSCVRVNGLALPCAVPTAAVRALVTDASGLAGVSWPNEEWSLELVR